MKRISGLAQISYSRVHGSKQKGDFVSSKVIGKGQHQTLSSDFCICDLAHTLHTHTNAYLKINNIQHITLTKRKEVDWESDRLVDMRKISQEVIHAASTHSQHPVHSKMYY